MLHSSYCWVIDSTLRAFFDGKMAVQIWIYTYHISGIGVLNNFSIFLLDGSFWVEVFRVEYHWVSAHCWFSIQTQRFTVSERHGRGFFAKDFRSISFSSEKVKVLEVLSHIISGKSKKQLEDAPRQRRFIPYHQKNPSPLGRFLKANVS